MPFDPQNYRLLLGAVGLIVLGYAVMLVDNAVNPDPVDSALSLVVAPLLLLAGYLGVAGAVIWGAPTDTSSPAIRDEDASGPSGAGPEPERAAEL